VSLVRTGFIPLAAGARPGFDHADVHLASRRMYVAHTGADRIDVLDCEEQAFLRSLLDLPASLASSSTTSTTCSSRATATPRA
jgi:hypothetical protein